MHQKFLTYVCCPDTGADLELTDAVIDKDGFIESGVLVSEKGARYPIVRGVPRFVTKEAYSNSFGYEWKKWSRVQFEDQNMKSRMHGHTIAVFNKCTGFDTKKISGKTVIEFGCGPGRFLDIVRKRGGLAIGLELSSAADVAHSNFKKDPNVLIVQGDILHPPFKKSSIDFGYTIGVLHHTPAPAHALEKLVSLIHPCGEVTCCVYENNAGKGLYDSRAVIAYRTFFNSLPATLAHRLAVIYSYFSAYVLYWFFFPALKIPGLRSVAGLLTRNVLPGLYYLRDGRWRVLDTFDAITPKFASTHTSTEVKKWFTDAGCTDILEMPFCTTAYKGTILCAA